MSSESVRSNKVKILNNKPFLLQHPNHKQKSYGALSQKLHCRRHILFTVKPANLKSRLLVEHIDLLRAAYMYVQKQYPFETIAVCVLPNHIHAIWTLPPDDADYSLRWRLIKTKFSARFPRAENLSASKQRRHERGIWQRRFYEHTVRDETDLQRCADYIHFNPVKHGLCGNVRDWPFSSFHRYVRDGWLPLDWGGTKETAVMSFGE